VDWPRSSADLTGTPSHSGLQLVDWLGARLAGAVALLSRWSFILDFFSAWCSGGSVLRDWRQKLQDVLRPSLGSCILTLLLDSTSQSNVQGQPGFKGWGERRSAILKYTFRSSNSMILNPDYTLVSPGELLKNTVAQVPFQTN